MAGTAVSRLRAFVLDLRQRLWARPLAAGLLSVLGVGLAGALDAEGLM